MDKKTFCPFLNGNCEKECMFYTVGATSDPDNIIRNCIIAKKLLELPDDDRQEIAFNAIISALKSHP